MAEQYTPKDFKSNQEIRWCPGCGDHGIINSVQKAMAELGYPKESWAVISGIGCSSRFPYYMNTYGFHTIHGRAAAIASGAKSANPKLNILQVSGDGDALAIGGNHFIHACRRNIDITTIVINNNIYGMTGGQFSPLTPKGKRATTAPYGSIDRSFDMMDLAKGAGATYVARGDVFHAALLTNQIVKAAQHKGFSVLEVLSTCPTSFGRYNKIPQPAAMLHYLEENTVSLAKAAKMTEEELAGKILPGEFYVAEGEPEYTEEYAKLGASCQEGGKQ